MAENLNCRPIITTTSSSCMDLGNSSTEDTPWYDNQSMQNVPEYLIVVEVILGLLVWTLIASTEYFRFPPFGWVMFVSVLCWLLTIFLLIISLAKRQIRHEQWTTVVLVFNCSAALMYMSAAIVEARMVDREVKGHHDYKCWAASTFFAFLISLSYVGSAFFSFKCWKSRGQ